MLRIARRAQGLAIVLACGLAVAGLAAGCGGGEDEDGTTGAGDSSAATKAGGAATGGEGGQPLGLASPKESVEEAQERLLEVLSSGDCDAANELNPLSRPELASQARCEALRRLERLEVTGAEEYGDAGAVIDYEVGTRTITAILILDQDGLFHIPFINVFNDDETAGTPYAKQFDEAAEQALQALEERDCSAYRDVAFIRFGRGKADEEVVCNYVENNPIGKLLEARPDAEFKRAGGNAYYAFYTLSTPGVTYTFLLARQQNSGAPPEAARLPSGAAEYAFVDSYRTNSRSAPE